MVESTRGPVLIVDDSPANLKVARVALETEGYEVRTANDGEEAWRALSGFAPQVILMDLQMPGLDGFELTRRIKADPEKRNIRIIAVTAYAMIGDRERALAAGCDDYIAKPIDPIELPKQVASHLILHSSVTPTAKPILVIDDNPTTRKLIRVALESDGHRVSEAGDARTALDWIDRHRPRLILQDLVLPDMDGIELVKRLHTKPNSRDVPILCLSGFLARIDDAKLLKDGFSALLVKPIDPIQLLEIVRVHLAGPRMAPPSAAGEPHVLVVDNDSLQRRLAEYHLVGSGFRVTAVSNAKQALAEVDRSIPAAIVIDILMPEMDGFELCLLLRQNTRVAHVPIVLVSAHYTETADRKLAEDVGASAFITRSGDWAHSLNIVREALEKPVTEARAVLELPAAREQILRRTLTQLDQFLHANTRLGQQCLLQAAQLSVLAGVADALARHTPLDGVLGDVLAVCLDLAGISKGVLYLREQGALEPRHWIGFGAEDHENLKTFFGHWHVLEEIIVSGQVRAIPCPSGTDEAENELLSRSGACSALIVPVMWGDRFFGALLLGARSQDLTGTDPSTFARVLGGQLGQAIGLAEAFSRLHASEAQFRALVDSMDHVTLVDRNLRILGVYGSGVERERIDPAAVVGRTLDEVLGPLEREAHERAHRRALAGESVTYEWSLSLGPDARHFQSSVFPVRDAAGQVNSVVRVGRDITEQKKLQAHVMVSDRMASVGMLAAGMAHEINNPLMAVLGNVQLALDGMNASGDSRWSATELEEALRDALDAGQRVEAIVRDLRLFSRAEEVRNTAVDVHAVLESTLRMARNELRHRASVVKDYGLVPNVRASESRLGQVFLNLLVNAAQALPEGCADRNEIRVVTRTDAGGRVVVEVHDTGPGIPAEISAKIFTPFVTTKPVGIGTGLGLAICQRIVTGIGGEIAFESTLGRGTIFRVTLPSDSESVPISRPRLSLRAATRRGRVLVIDDDAALTSLVRKALAPDHEVECTSDARASLEDMRAGTSYDVILSDLMMPVMSGVHFYEQLVRVRPDLAERTVFFTGGAFTSSAREFLATSSIRCLEKPFEIGALRSLVNEMMG
jgi:PAS domain S-box-containing protein